MDYKKWASQYIRATKDIKRWEDEAMSPSPDQFEDFVNSYFDGFTPYEVLEEAGNLAEQRRSYSQMCGDFLKDAKDEQKALEEQLKNCEQ